MKRLVLLLCVMCAMATSVYAGPDEGTYSSSGNTNTTPLKNAYGLVVRPINGSPAQSLTIASAVTTNTTTTPVAGVSGTKNFQWRVTGTGAVTQTVVLKGSFDSDGASPTDLCTITLSGTAPVYDVCQPFTAPFPYLFVTTTSTTGTGASGTGRVGY